MTVIVISMVIYIENQLNKVYSLFTTEHCRKLRLFLKKEMFLLFLKYKDKQVLFKQKYFGIKNYIYVQMKLSGKHFVKKVKSELPKILYKN